MRLAEKALALSGGNSPDMLENLAEVQHALNQNAAAVETLRKALAMDPANIEYRELLTKWQGSVASAAIKRTEARRGPFTNLW